MLGCSLISCLIDTKPANENEPVLCVNDDVCMGNNKQEVPCLTSHNSISPQTANSQLNLVRDGL